MTALMFFRLSGIILIFGIWTTVAEAGEFWKKKRPEDWTARQAPRILQKSPWAKQRRLLLDFVGRGQRTSGTSRGGNISVRDPTREGRVLAEAEKGDIYRVPGSKRPSTQRDDIRPEASREAVYLIRLESAAPVAAAFQRLKELRLESMAKFQSPPPRLPADRYVITVKTTRPGESSPHLFRGLPEEALKRQARLKTPLGEVAPAEVESSGMGASAAVHFFFPRTQNGQPPASSEELRMEIRIKGQHLRLKTKFVLPK